MISYVNVSQSKNVHFLQKWSDFFQCSQPNKGYPEYSYSSFELFLCIYKKLGIDHQANPHIYLLGNNTF